MSDILNNKRYFEAILMGTSARKSKEEIARRGLLDLDRIEHVLRIHKSTMLDGAQRCATCKSNFPCQTTRALTGE